MFVSHFFSSFNFLFPSPFFKNYLVTYFPFCSFFSKIYFQFVSSSISLLISFFAFFSLTEDARIILVHLRRGKKSKWNKCWFIFVMPSRCGSCCHHRNILVQSFAFNKATLLFPFSHIQAVPDLANKHWHLRTNFFFFSVDLSRASFFLDVSGGRPICLSVSLMARCLLATKEPHHCQHHEGTWELFWSMGRVVHLGKILSPKHEMDLDCLKP